MKCPKCGKAMVIRLSESIRVWGCQDWDKFGDQYCATTIEIPSDERLPIAVIAEDMAQRAFTDSHEAGKRQAGFRRIAGSINKLMDGWQYLSESEFQALKEAAEVLERLGSAAEKAKGVKKRLEQEEKRRKEQRYKEADSLLARIYGSDDLLERAVNTLYLAAVNGRLVPFSVEDIERIFKDAGKGRIKESLTNMVTYQYNEMRRELAGDFAWRQRPLEELVKVARVDFNGKRALIKAENYQLLDAMKTVIAVDSGSNIERLGK